MIHSYIAIGLGCMACSVVVVLAIERNLKALCSHVWTSRLTSWVLHFCGGLNLFGAGLAIYGLLHGILTNG